MLKRRYLFLAVVLSLWGLATHGTYAGTGDEPHYLAIAHSLAFDLDLDLANNYGKAEPLIAGGELEPGAHGRPGVGGSLRPVHDVGMPLLFAPYVRVTAPLAALSIPHASSGLMRRLRLTPTVLYRHLLSAVMILVAGWLAVLMFDTFCRSGASRHAAFGWALLIALSPPMLVMSVLFFTEVVSALLCLVVFRMLTAESSPPVVPSAIAGALAGLLVIVHIRNAGLVAGLVGLALYRLTRRRPGAELAVFAGGFAVLLAARTAINYMFWGTLVASQHARRGEWNGVVDAAATMATRTAGLLFDQEFGLLPYAPVFALAPLGCAALARSNRPLLWSIVVVAGAYLLAVIFPLTNAHGWTGGWSPAARFVVPIIPLVGLAIVAGARSLPRAAVTGIVVLQVCINAYFWQQPKNLWNDADGIAAICERGSARFCGYLPSFVGPSDRQEP